MQRKFCKLSSGQKILTSTCRSITNKALDFTASSEQMLQWSLLFNSNSNQGSPHTKWLRKHMSLTILERQENRQLCSLQMPLFWPAFHWAVWPP